MTKTTNNYNIKYINLQKFFLNIGSTFKDVSLTFENGNVHLYANGASNQLTDIIDLGSECTINFELFNPQFPVEMLLNNPYTLYFTLNKIPKATNIFNLYIRTVGAEISITNETLAILAINPKFLGLQTFEE